MKLEARGKWVIVQPAPKETKSKGGVLLPDEVSTHSALYGIVVAEGEFPSLKSKQVIYDRYAEVVHDGHKFHAVKEDDIFASMD